jgi:hypothetical protein
MRRDALDDVAQIDERIDLQVLAGLHERTQDGGSVRRRFAPGEEPAKTDNRQQLDIFKAKADLDQEGYLAVAGTHVCEVVELCRRQRRPFNRISSLAIIHLRVLQRLKLTVVRAQKQASVRHLAARLRARYRIGRRPEFAFRASCARFTVGNQDQEIVRPHELTSGYTIHSGSSGVQCVRRPKRTGPDA